MRGSSAAVGLLSLKTSQFIFKFEGNAEPHSSQMTANWTTTKKVQNNKDSATQKQAWKEKKKKSFIVEVRRLQAFKVKLLKLNSFNYSTDFIVRNSTFGKLVRTHVDDEGLALLDGQSKIWKKSKDFLKWSTLSQCGTFQQCVGKPKVQFPLECGIRIRMHSVSVQNINYVQCLRTIGGCRWDIHGGYKYLKIKTFTHSKEVLIWSKPVQSLQAIKTGRKTLKMTDFCSPV